VARRLAAASHDLARVALRRAAPPGPADELERITDFIHSRTS
jgi:hypothetical protein